jgi:pimeloyl-ACP methyl ester carboxylesterase
MIKFLITLSLILNSSLSQIVSSDTKIDSKTQGIKLNIRYKYSQGKNLNKDRTLLFVHGATYPASTTFDFKINQLSWMDYIAEKGWNVYLLDYTGYGLSDRPASMDASPE